MAETQWKTVSVSLLCKISLSTVLILYRMCELCQYRFQFAPSEFAEQRNLPARVYIKSLCCPKNCSTVIASTYLPVSIDVTFVRELFHVSLIQLVFRPDMPQTLSISDLVVGLTKSMLENVRHWMHLAFVSLMWLFFVPTCICT